jgi:hypothetical protein
MKNIVLLTVALTAGRAQAGPALDCLEASARAGNLEACLNEEDRNGDIPGVAASDPAPKPSLAASAPVKPAPRRVPTPAGWTDGEDGTLETGFYKGLDSGYKTVFAGIVWPAVAGLEATGYPMHHSHAGDLFAGLGFLLSIPASIIGALVGAPVGAVAGMIAEKASPGSTKDWFTF